MSFAGYSDDEDSVPRVPWTVLAFLAAPIVIVSAVIGLFYSASFALTGAPPGEEARSSAFALAVLANHLILFTALIWLLNRNGESLADIGWTGRPTPGFVLSQAGAALLVAALLLAFRIAIFEPLRAILDGNAPDFVLNFDPGLLGPGEYVRVVVMVFLAFVGDSLYRGYAIPRLAGHWGYVAAVLISAGFYALIHLGRGGPEDVAFAFFGGILLGVLFLTVARGRLWGLAAGHALYNAVSWAL